MQVGLTIGYGDDVTLLLDGAIIYGLSANDPGTFSASQAIYVCASCCTISNHGRLMLNLRALCVQVQYHDTLCHICGTDRGPAGPRQRHGGACLT